MVKSGDEKEVKAIDRVGIFQEFSNSMRSLVTLASALLVLPVTMLKALSPGGPIPFNWCLLIGWVALLSSILAGLAYQLIAAAKIQEELGGAKFQQHFGFHVKAYHFAIISFIVGLLFLLLGLIFTA
ncbi:hypothetical protein IWQ54_001167 [Labrenzia sp. EL_195]|nr:hypothetical protein [Labrenzia sp. EL_195]